MTVHELTQRICGELPDGYQIVIELEKGSGSAHLLLPESDTHIDHDSEIDGFENQVIDLLEQAKDIHHENVMKGG